MTKHGSFSSFDHLSCFRHFGLRNFTIGIASKESILPRRSWAKTACWHPRAAGTAATTGQPKDDIGGRLLYFGAERSERARAMLVLM